MSSTADAGPSGDREPSSGSAAALTQAAILGQLAEGVIVTDPDGRITLVNEAAAAIHGVARLDVEPDAYSETYRLFMEDGRPYPPRELPLARAVRGEVVTQARWRIRRPDGAEVLAIGNAQPVRDAEGRQIGAVLVLRDDTAREAAERALREMNATLAQRIEERTREAETARIEAERASAAKSDFLAAMSHEIRTPLNGVMGYIDLLLELVAPGTPESQYAERIQSSGAALLTVVDDILDFSKIEAGHIALTTKPFALAPFIDNALSIVRASAERKGLTLVIDADARLPGYVKGDLDRLRQVLLNLLNNAVKFTPSGGITLRISRLDTEDGHEAALRFAVEDTGIGIPADKVHLLFERFSQVDGTIHREFGGTGLGLAISKRLVEMMGGAIGVTSTEGVGSTFWFELTLPISSSEALTPAPAALSTTKGRRVLLVEDVPLNQDLAAVVLRAAGHQVDVASSGAEAIAAVQARAYDIVLMDVQMPGMDGLTATQRIRALDHPCSTVPIIAMTANVLPQQVSAARAAGMNDHVGKPFKREVLLSAIERHAEPALVEAEHADGALDDTTFDDLAEMVGRDTANALLTDLAAELSSRFVAIGDRPDRERCAADAHAMISASGMLGFTQFAALCQDLEAACLAGQPFEPLLFRVRVAKEYVIAGIADVSA